MRAVIFGNGELGQPELLHEQLRPDDLLVAANGGLRHCRALGLTPAVLVGDMDSLAEQEVLSAEEAGAQVLRHPSRKDQTDLELAARMALERGATELLVIAGLGRRWDQTLANLLLAAHPMLQRTGLTFLDGRQRITAVRGQMTLHGQIGDTVSLVPLAGEARGVTTLGLEYPLQDGVLAIGSSLGVSNVLVAPRAVVSVREGILLCIHEPKSVEGGKP
jgi:thiamine pyrophosphokinase